ncbi:hypothetical protein MJO29_000944 [Puccinia striiformis f. sp. tritici]|nr:hypothetical protein MJO29_000944 [Puccinia striiformis f. sp. tritici]
MYHLNYASIAYITRASAVHTQNSPIAGSLLCFFNSLSTFRLCASSPQVIVQRRGSMSARLCRVPSELIKEEKANHALVLPKVSYKSYTQE